MRKMGQGVSNTQPFIDWLGRTHRRVEFKLLRDRYLLEGYAKGEAWEMAATHFGWSPGWTADDPAVEPAVVRDPRVSMAAALPEWDIERDLLWAYHHVRNPAMTGENAPSGGAAILLDVARDDPKEFAKQILGLLKDERKKKQMASQMADDKRRKLDILDRIGDS